MKKKGFQLRRIRESGSSVRRKESGQVETVTGLFFLLFLAIILCALLRTELYRMSALYMEDALAASNLASAVIDVEEYGISHNILIQDLPMAFQRYEAALQGNLNLEEDWQCANRGLIAGKVEIRDYIVYNCVGNTASAYRIDEGGIRECWQGAVGGMKAPNGQLVEATGIYSEIAYPVVIWQGETTEARKGKLVDIVINE